VFDAIGLMFNTQEDVWFLLRKITSSEFFKKLATASGTKVNAVSAV
jgi:hypothetical protein